MAEGWDYDEARRRFPDHWDEDGRPAIGSVWRSRSYLFLRVRVTSREAHDDIRTCVYWDGPLDVLPILFTYDSRQRWNLEPNGLVYSPAGVTEDGHWREAIATLDVTFDMPMFGGPDTLHHGRDGWPFFEPIPDPDL